MRAQWNSVKRLDIAEESCYAPSLLLPLRIPLLVSSERSARFTAPHTSPAFTLLPVPSGCLALRGLFLLALV